MTEIKEELKTDSHSRWDKIRKGFYKAGGYATIALATLGNVDATKYIMSSDDKVKDPIENTTADKRSVHFQVDTLSNEVSAAAYFNPGYNSIVQNYVLNQDNSYNQVKQQLYMRLNTKITTYPSLRIIP